MTANTAERVSDEMPDVANHADIALQDAMYEWLDEKTGEKLWLYDAAKFLASMRGNGYQISRRSEGAGEREAREEALEEAARIVEYYSLPTIQTPSMWLIDKAAIAKDIRSLKSKQ